MRILITSVVATFSIGLASATLITQAMATTAPIPMPTASTPSMPLVDGELAAALTESETTQVGRDWQACRYGEGDTSIIVCPDGFILTS